MSKQTPILLTFEQLLDACTKRIDNAVRPHSAGVCLLKEHPEICLGLFQLGQEELGKSYSCLAAPSVREDAKEFWKSFWEEWEEQRNGCILFKILYKITESGERRLKIWEQPGERLI